MNPTCRYCGAALKRYSRKVSVNAPLTPGPRKYDVDWAKRNVAADGEEVLKVTRKWGKTFWVVELWQPGAWGLNGCGYFCDMGCAYMFAVAIAKQQDKVWAEYGKLTPAEKEHLPPYMKTIFGQAATSADPALVKEGER